MPKNKDLKRTVRARMRKTGESYTSARSKVVREKTDYAAIAGMSDAAVRAKTGKTWEQWVRALDRVDAAAWPHKQIARYLHQERGVSPWWSQTVTVGYERVRGLRDKGQRRGGGYDVNKSKTFPVAVDELYGAFAARRRKRWLGDVGLTIKKATPHKSYRITWEDGRPVEVYFWEKGPGKSQVQLQHRELASSAEAEQVRVQWTERLAALGRELRGA